MSARAQSSIRNRILRALPEATFAKLAPHLVAVDLPLRFELVGSDQQTPYFYFIESGLASVIASCPKGNGRESIETGHLGFEGMSGLHLLLMAETTPGRTFMQVAGDGLRIDAAFLMETVMSDQPLQAFLLRYAFTCHTQVAQSVLVNGRFKVYERLARWLLMCADRLPGTDMSVTHEFLALMLGVRRSGVTTELHILEGEHAIRSTRGLVRVLDRAKLESIAGGSYGVPEREYERLMRYRSKEAA
jgi:CRP-like cAMP-binding protein